MVREWCRELGVHLSANQIDAIMAQLDVDEDGYLDYFDFLRHFGGSVGVGKSVRQPEQTAKKLKETVFNELRAALKRQGGGDLETAFRQFDTEGNGRISRKEFENALKMLNVDLTPKLVEDVMRGVDSDASGFIDYRAFVKQFQQLAGTTSAANSDLKRENARLYERLKDLERRLHSKDSDDAIRAKEAAHVKNMQVVYAQQCAQYEATIANLQHQLAMALKGGGGQSTGGTAGKKGQLGSRVAELQAQVCNISLSLSLSLSL